MKGDLIMKRYRCCGCGTIYTGWGIKETCQICGGKLELVSGKKREEVKINGERNRRTKT